MKTSTGTAAPKTAKKKRKIIRFVGKVTKKSGQVVYAWRDLHIKGIPIYG